LLAPFFVAQAANSVMQRQTAGGYGAAGPDGHASPLAGYVSSANLVVDGGGQRPAYAEAVRPDHPET
jgi:hypothetical protein